MSGKLQSGDQPDPNKYDRNRMYGRLSSMNSEEREIYLRELRGENDRDLINLFHQVNIGLDKDQSKKLYHHADDSWLAEMVHLHVRDSLSSTGMADLLEYHDMLRTHFPLRNDGGERDALIRKSRTLVDGEIERRGQDTDNEKSKLRSKD